MEQQLFLFSFSLSFISKPFDREIATRVLPLHPFRSSREANVGNGTDIYNI